MTTESSVRFVGDTGARNWSRANEVVIPSSARDLELLLKGQKFHGSRRDAAPSRSGSAPPSMEGSLYALANFDKPDESSLDGRLSNINSFELQESEDQLRADPAYIAYYLSNINLNPRLPPPLISRENRHLARQIGRWGVNQALHSFDDSNKGYLMSCQAPLSTHEEGVEEDSSPTADSGACYLSGRYLYSKEGQYKSRVDLIQEDNPQAPSPIHSDQFPLSSHGLREVIHSDAHVNPQQDLSKKKTKSLELGIYAGDSTKHVRSDETIRNNDLSASYLPSTSSHESERIFYRHIEPKRGSNMERDKLATDGTGSIVGKITTGTRNISILNEQKNYHPRKNLQHISSHSRSSAAQCHASSSNMIPQSLETQYLQNDIDQFSDRQSKLPLPIDINPRLQMNGYSVPVYGGAANYMNLGNFFYPDVQQSSLFSPHYSIGGYAVNASIVPSLFTGYASPGAIVTVERPVNVTGGNVALGVDWQQMYKYGHLGVPVRPSVLDPSYYPYLQQPFFNAFEAFSQYDPLMHNYDLQKAHLEASSSPHQMPHQRNSVNIHNQMKGAISSPSYYASPQNLATPLQCPSSSFITSSIQGSPVVGTTLPVMRNEDIMLPVASHRKAESYPGWHGQRGHERIDDPKTYSLLDELKSGKPRRFEFSDMIGRILEFSTDQHGSRFIQQKLEHCNDKEKKHMFEEVLPHASTLMTDVFGNYVIQKFFEHGNTEQRKELANKLVGRVLSLSLQMHGCRVVQKAFEVVENDQKTELVKEFDGNIMRCVRDQNGNHVIQKCIECVPTERIGFIISFFQGQVATLSTHLYGCRVIQRVLEHCTDELQSQSIIDEVLQSACFLAQDQYGNYVIQHVLERGRPQERSQIISKLAGQIVNLSQNKFASNVIEKCLEHGDSVERELLIEEMVGQTEGNENLLVMMKDQYANYVIQKILDICDAKQQEILVNRIKVHLPGLKKYTYGKHIVTRVEKLSSEGSHASSD